MSGDGLPDTCSGVYREVARYCGLDTAKALYLHFAGVALKIPRRVPADHPIAAKLGVDAAERLSAHFAGELLLVPLRWLSGRQLAHVVLSRLAAGERMNDIAHELRVSRRYIERLRKGGMHAAEADEDADEDAAFRSRQLNLF